MPTTRAWDVVSNLLPAAIVVGGVVLVIVIARAITRRINAQSDYVKPGRSWPNQPEDRR